MSAAAGGRYATTVYNEVLPFAALVVMECINVGLNTLFKAATNQGMSNHVFVVYAYGVAAICLLPSPFFSTRSRVLPPLNCSVTLKILLLGVIGCASQVMGYAGISYSSPTLASAISNLVPAFTFILALFFRMETLVLRSPTSRAKVMGTIVSVTGAFVVTLYKGPRIAVTTTTSPHTTSNVIGFLSSTQSNWMLGGLFLTTEYLLVPMWYIVQTQIMKVYPAELTVVFFYNLIVSVLAAIVGAFMVPDLTKWKIRLDISLASIICSGIFGSFVNNTIHTWALRVKGPVYVAMFKPLSIAIAVAMGVVILGDTLYLGSIIGSTIIAIGFYTVMWGKAKEKDDNLKASDLESLTAEKLPLLQGRKCEDMLNESSDR
ncbi:hypothetical protein DM860_005151 [Cuscuta australis]|uniref:WAT1-related protein n=1 Tax=Cuscuta australis TaxID=267555 RepID=A0A328DMJ2_9ASTE|nr:hypothetical protein DM860_005151 [Cuscuta australis]